MARLPRFVLIGQPQHVIVRGNNKEPIFYREEDYQFYLEKLKSACEKHDCELHAYVLMTNHIHLLITPNKINGLSKVMQMIGRYYVQYFNVTNKRTGTLWEGRYKATLIDSEVYALTCYRYIELNPVRANMVEQPSDYPWSSYHSNALGKENELITPHYLYKKLGLSDKQRQKTYQGLFNSHIDEKTLSDIRESTNKSWVLGSENFKALIEKKLERSCSPKPKGGDRRSDEYRQKTNINRV
jgi:putative transposase